MSEIPKARKVIVQFTERELWCLYDAALEIREQWDGFEYHDIPATRRKIMSSVIGKLNDALGEVIR